MSEPLFRFRQPGPAQKARILSASDAFGLAAGCARPLCRRAGACRGFDGEAVPRCVFRLVPELGACLRAIAAFLPPRERHEPGEAEAFDRQYARIQKSLADYVERQLARLAQPGKARGAGR